MTFTYAPSDGFTDLERVRFWIGDTVSTKAKFSDEEITALINETDSWQAAAVGLLRGLVARMSADSDFKADWLEVKTSQAIPQLRTLIKELESQWGLGAYDPANAPVVDSGAVYPYRSDIYSANEIGADDAD
ncbi:MAG: hypothetical protein MUF38_05775 [Anaerolineae bacterium]|jgi:hypothetical protein|nr:hypothetical protein [Anaerolineae bacterium]